MMKSIKYIIFAFIGTLFLTTCKEIDTLKRDNPLDVMKNGIVLNFNSYTVHSDNNNDKNVNPGE